MEIAVQKAWKIEKGYLKSKWNCFFSTFPNCKLGSLSFWFLTICMFLIDASLTRFLKSKMYTLRTVGEKDRLWKIRRVYWGPILVLCSRNLCQGAGFGTLQGIWSWFQEWFLNGPWHGFCTLWGYQNSFRRVLEISGCTKHWRLVIATWNEDT